MRYFRILQDSEIENRWFPGRFQTVDGVLVDPRTFTRCERYRGGKLALETAVEGEDLSVTFGPFDALVIDRDLGERLMTIAVDSVQLVPVDAEFPDKVLLNVLASHDCIDSQRTEGELWSELDGRPEMTGKYRTIRHLVIDPNRAAGSEIFRVTGWRSSLIVSERLKNMFTLLDSKGLIMVEV